MSPENAFVLVAAMLTGLQLSASGSDRDVDLSNKNLSSVPRDLPQTVESLDLSCNNIQQLQQGDFRNTTVLRILDMSRNSLDTIDPETFLSTSLLENLDLSHNRLKNLSNQQYLLHTGNLLVLNLAFNEFLAMTLGSEFSSLSNLERLEVGAVNISVGDFRNVAQMNLQTLTLSVDAELMYEAGSLKDVHAQRLQVAFGRHQMMDQQLFADALALFEEVELLNLIRGYDDLCQQLNQTAEIHTSHLYLTNISVSWHDFLLVINQSLQNSIVHLTITDVVLNALPLKETTVAPTTRTKSFTVRRAVVKSFIFSQEAVYNFLINIPAESLAVVETSIITMTCPKLQSPVLQLNFSTCTLSDSIFSRVEGETLVECENLQNMRRLILAGNNLKNLQLLSKRMRYMSSLRDLDLSLNSLVYDGLEECSWPPNISNMTLSSNGLTDLVFKCLPRGTETLDLQNNQVSLVPSYVLQLENLSSLNLNSNRLRDLPVCHGFPRLQELLLMSNSLHAPSVHKLESCPNLRTLDVRSNPFTCTCALRSFIRLGMTSKRHNDTLQLLSWPWDYNCTYPDAFRDSTLNNVVIPEVSCSVGLLAASILCPVVVLSLLVLTVCHRLDVPWYMGMIWQWARAKHRARTHQAEDLVGVEFHAFVSYSQHDADWVQNSFLPHLEGSSGGLRICHHQKNFVPGKTIIENILTCLEKSRRCVFVLSVHFVKSDWCHYELYFAHHQRHSQGSDGIVLVLLEPLPQYLIPSKYYQLKSMMGRHTYLEWPQEKNKQRLFWANLRAALQKDMPNIPVTEEGLTQ